MSNNIQSVVLYLRKSRDEENQGTTNVLVKHKMKLVEQAKAFGWNVLEIFEEVASSIDPTRPQYVAMQEFCKAHKVDAIVTYALDRLNRDLEEGSRCYKWLERDGILLVAAGNVYDLANNDSRNMAEVLLTFSGMEYRAIKGRMKGGKLAGTKLGRWSHGTPPVGYTYNPATKGLDVEPEGMKLYEHMKAELLAGKTIRQVTYALNKAGVKSPRGVAWAPAVINKILQSRVYLGESHYGDAVGYGDWGVTTEEEYAQMVLQIKQNNAIPTRTSDAIATRKFSTLVECAKCGHFHTFGWARNRSYMQMKPCNYRSPEGVKCGNSGIKESELASILADELRMTISKSDAKMKPTPTVQNTTLLDNVREEIKKHETAIGRIRTLFEDGDYTKEEYQERVTERKTRLQALRQEEKKLAALMDLAGVSDAERLDRLKAALASLTEEDADPAEVNRQLKHTFSKIVWRRESPTADIEFEIVFR